MAKTLRVINPFFIMEPGDLFEYSEETNMYISKHKEDFYKVDDESVNEMKSSYSAEFQISSEYAKNLLKEGFLEEVTKTDKNSDFRNIFDEIDCLLDKYTKDLLTVEKDTMGLPTCVKVEREAVFTNLITLLKHLKSLKK